MVLLDRINRVVASAAVKLPVVVATSAAITLSGLQTIGSVTLASGDRVLVKDQADSSENGIYKVSDGDWSRTVDFNGKYDVVSGTLVTVTGASSPLIYRAIVDSNEPIIGTDAITFEIIQTTGAGSSYTPGVTGGVSTTIQAALDRAPLTAQGVFGAAADGVTDDSATIQSAINYIGSIGGGTLRFEKGDYYFEGTADQHIIDITDDYIRLEFDPGARVLANGHEFGDHSSIAESIIGVNGAKGSAILLTSDSLAGSTEVELASVSGISPGDFLLISDDKIADGQNLGTIIQVASISGNTLSINGANRISYQVTDNAQVETLDLVKGFEIHGMTLVGIGNDAVTRGDTGIHMEFCENPQVINCNISKVENLAVSFSSCVSPVAARNYIVLAGDNTSPSLQYGIAVGTASVDAEFYANTVIGPKHGILTTTASAVSRGVPMRSNFHSNHIQGSWHAGMMVHKATYDYQVVNNRFLGCHACMELRGPYGVFSENFCIESQEDPIYVKNLARDIKISDNYIYGVAPNFHGVRVADFDSGHLPERISITDNQIRDANIGIYVFDDSSTVLRDGLKISGNFIHETTDDSIFVRGPWSGMITDNEIDSSDEYGMNLIGVRYILIKGNSLTKIGGANGIRVTDNGTPAIVSDYVVVRDNFIAGYGTAAVDISGATGSNNVSSNDDMGSSDPS